MPRISVVTVCFNEENTIGKTIESVLDQDYRDYEYVIMDGCSTDATLEVIKEYSGDERLFYYSELDEGIYDAMNKSLDKIKGEYVIFLNSGDWFFDRRVLTDISDNLKADVVYGNVYRRCSKGNYVQKYKGTNCERIRMMLCGLAFCHQTQFTRTDVMRAYRFRESHKITADFDVVVRLLKDQRTFLHIDRIVCSFDHDGGISAQPDNYLQMTKEDDESIRECFPILFYITIVPKIMYRFFLRKEYRKRITNL